MNSRLDRSISASNTSLSSSLRRPYNDNQKSNAREREPLAPKNPIDLTFNESSSEHSKINAVYNEKAVVDDEEISDMLDKMCSTPAKSEATGWRTLIDYPKDFFEVVVLYVNEAENTIFVMETKYESHALKLLKSINRQINKDSPSLSPEDIRESSLYAVPFESMYYRAEVVTLWKEKQTATVYLIDYGNQFDCKFSELKASIPIMKNLNAYGFRVRLKNIQKVQDDDLICIKIVDKADSSKTFTAEIQQSEPTKENEKMFVPVSPLKMAQEIGSLDCFVSYIFPNENAVLATFNDNKVGDQLKKMSDALEKTDHCLTDVEIGEFIFSKLQHVFLVSLILDTYIFA